MPLIPFVSPLYLPAAPGPACAPARRRRRCVGRTAWRARCHVLGALLLCDAARATLPDALPVDAQIREGAVAITRDARGMQILQTGEHAIIDWRSFDVGRSVSLRVLQPSADAALLNRVLGDTASDIAGELSANGEVHLVNPNGIRISPGGAVSAAGFVAATLDITNADFAAGDLRFGVLGQANAGTVVHAGTITSQPGGFVALLGHRVEQSGLILTSVGQVGLGAGAAMKLTPGQDRFLEVTLAQGAATRAAGGAASSAAGGAASSAAGGATGSAAGGTAGGTAGGAAGGTAGGTAGGVGRMAPAITVSGRIEADGGLVQISAPMAAARGQAPADAVNLSGIVQARHVFVRTGTILIDGDGGVVRLSGRLDASSNEMRGARRSGGTVEVSGLQVLMEDGGIDVSGALGGGRVRVTAWNAGLGDGDGPRSLMDDGVGDPLVFVGAWARINASATYQGSAGDVALASDGRVVFLGQGQARGASVGAAHVSGPMRMTVVADMALPTIEPAEFVRMPTTPPRLMRTTAVAPRNASLLASLSPSPPPSPPLSSRASPAGSSDGYSPGSSVGSPAGFVAGSPAGIRARFPARLPAIAPFAATPDVWVRPAMRATLLPDARPLAPPSGSRTPLPGASRRSGLSIDIPVDPAPWAMPPMRRSSNSGLHDL